MILHRPAAVVMSRARHMRMRNQDGLGSGGLDADRRPRDLGLGLLATASGGSCGRAHRHCRTNSHRSRKIELVFIHACTPATTAVMELQLEHTESPEAGVRACASRNLAIMGRDMTGTGRYPPQPKYPPFAFYSCVRLGDPEQLQLVRPRSPHPHATIAASISDGRLGSMIAHSQRWSPLGLSALAPHPIPRGGVAMGKLSGGIYVFPQTQCMCAVATAPLSSRNPAEQLCVGGVD